VAKDDVIYRTEVVFNAIYVIESLRLRDPKTGSDLYDNVIYPATRQLDGLYTQFRTAQNITELVQRLADVGRDVRREGRLPLIHLEAHGTDDGIMLADETEVTWRTLVPLLGDINQACRMNLTVIAISCMGSNLVRFLMPSDRAPLFMLIGPRGVMTHEELLQATSRFYESLVDALIHGHDINRALEAMNYGLEYDAWPLRPATAEILFWRAFRRYIEEETEDELREVENGRVAQITSEQNLNLLQAAAVRERVRDDLADKEGQYNRLRETFLMMDLFPESRPRFGLTFELCIRRPSDDELAKS
jgi:hypothetical protein